MESKTFTTWYIGTPDGGRFAHHGYSKYHERRKALHDKKDHEVYGPLQALDHANELKEKGQTNLILICETIVTISKPLSL